MRSPSAVTTVMPVWRFLDRGDADAGADRDAVAAMELGDVARDVGRQHAPQDLLREFDDSHLRRRASSPSPPLRVR